MTKKTWQIDETHAGVHFTVRHMVFAKVHGKFDKFSGQVIVDSDDFTKSEVTATIQTASIHTGVDQRDGHLRSPDFFDVEKYPTIAFKSSGVEKKSDSHYLVHGELTIRGVTKNVVLDTEFGGKAKDPWGVDRMGFSAKTSIERKDFGLTWNQVLEAGGVLVGEKVDINIEVELTPANA